MITHTIKRGDTGRTFTDTLTLDGAPIVLTGATVKLIWRDTVSSTTTLRNATITDAAAGKVSYTPVTGDVATAGLVLLEWEITLAGGAVLSVPQDDYIRLTILADLG